MDERSSVGSRTTGRAKVSVVECVFVCSISYSFEINMPYSVVKAAGGDMFKGLDTRILRALQSRLTCFLDQDIPWYP